MSDHSAIEWTDATWNPVTGCSHVSPGCLHCYAETLSPRRGWSKKPWTAQNAAENVVLHPDRLSQPLKWKRPRRIFVNSMSDLFHEQIPFYFIADVFGVMQRAHWHTFQVLTKRPARALEFMQWMEAEDDEVGGNLRDEGDWPCPNVWLGVSVEDQRRALERIPILLRTPAAVRFLSCEPLLGPLDLGSIGRCSNDCVEGHHQPERTLDWVIVGGESGAGFRKMDPDWARSIRDQCVTAGIPYFFKQWGGRIPKAGGNELDGRTWQEFPERQPA